MTNARGSQCADIAHGSKRGLLARLLPWLSPGLLLIWLLCVATPVNAQLQTPPATGPAARAPIAVTDILARAEEDRQRIDRARRLLSVADDAVPLAKSLADIEKPVDARLEALDGKALQRLPILRLESLERHWRFDERRFAHWQAEARRSLAPYADSAAQLAARRVAWAATRAEGQLDAMPDVLADRVTTMLEDIEATERALAAVLTRHFELAARAGELESRLRLGRAGVDAAIEEFDRRLFRIDVPPLWATWFSLENSRAPLAAMKQGIEIERDFAIDYHAVGSNNQRARTLFQFLLLPLVLLLFVRSRPAPGSVPDAAAGATPSRRPFSVWLLLSMLSVWVLEPDGPILTQEFALMLALIPVVRLLPAGLLRRLGSWPYVAAVFYFFDRLGVATVSDSHLYRLFLLVLTVMALGLTGWMLRRMPSADSSLSGRLKRSVQWVGCVVMALMSISLVANVLGNTSLAETLTSGVIDSGYFALLMHASVAACLGLLRAVLGQPELLRYRTIGRHGVVLQAACRRILVFGAAAGWLLYSIDRFRVLRPLQNIGTSVMALGVDVGEVSVDLGDVLAFLFSVWLAFWIARVVRTLLRDELSGHAALPRGVGSSIASLSYYGTLLLGFLVALSAAGFKVSQLTLVFSALGVGIGFGLQNVVNNFVCGLVLMFERPIQPGDVVDAAGTSGRVREIGLRATVIRTFDGADVIVPNGLLLNGNLANWTMFDRSRRIEVQVSVSFGSDPDRVLAVLTSAARKTVGVADRPAPAAIMTAYGGSSLDFAVRAWTHDVDEWMAVRGALLANVLVELSEAGISMPFAQHDLHLRSLPAGVDAWFHGTRSETPAP